MKISEHMKGNKIWLGKKHTGESKEKISKTHKGLLTGSKNPNWKGGITPRSMMIRKSDEYKLWQIAVFIRDKRTCIWCGSKKHIEADHIKPFAFYPELRFAIDNGRTLCHECHKTTDTYLNNKNIKI